MTSHGFSITAPFACTMRMSSSDAGSPSDRMTTFACPSSEYHEKLVAMRYRSSLPVFGTADAHAAPVLMSKTHHEVSAVDPDVSQQQRGKRSCLSIGFRCRTMTSEGHEEYSISRSHLCWVLVAPAMPRQARLQIRCGIHTISQNLCISSLWYQLSCTTSAGATHPHSLVPLRHKVGPEPDSVNLHLPEASHHKTPPRVLQAAQRYLSSTKRDPDVASILQLNRRLSLTMELQRVSTRIVQVGISALSDFDSVDVLE